MRPRCWPPRPPRPPLPSPPSTRAMAFEGSISSLVKMRDEDGSVDRVQDPPQELWPVLACLRYKAIDDHIDLPSVFVVCRDLHVPMWVSLSCGV